MVNPKVSFPAKKLPSYLKGLVDSRARADGDVQRIAPVVTAARAALARSAAKLAKQEASLGRAQVARDACDTLLRKWSEAIDADSIASVQAWRGRYGERGALRQQILVLVEAAGPEGVSTSALADQLIALFGLSFLSHQARNLWVHDTVSSALKALTCKRTIERATPGGAATPGAFGGCPKRRRTRLRPC
jgi:hypothetical protein